MIPGKIFLRFAKVQGSVSVKDFSVPRRLQEPCFCFARVGLKPLGGQVLYHHGISMIVPRFTLFTLNFVICSNQITGIFRSGHDCVSVSSARRPCYFGLQAYFTIRILRKVRKHTVLTRTQFHVRPRLRWRFMRRSGSACTSLHRVPRNSSKHFHQPNSP